MGRKIYYEPYNRVLVELRQSQGVATIYRDGAWRKIVYQLKKNEIIGMAVDQDVEKFDGIFVSFFGRPAWTTTAPAKISLATGAALIPMFMLHQGGKYKLWMDEVILPEAYAAATDPVKTMNQQWSLAIEKCVRQNLAQWAWMHNRWKTTPEVVQKGNQHD